MKLILLNVAQLSSLRLIVTADAGCAAATPAIGSLQGSRLTNDILSYTPPASLLHILSPWSDVVDWNLGHRSIGGATWQIVAQFARDISC